MFLETTLQEKFNRNYNTIDNDPLTLPKHPYQPSQRDPRILLSFKPYDSYNNSYSYNENNTSRLRALDKKEWQQNFTIKKLHNKWSERADLDFLMRHKKFSDDTIPSKVVNARQYINDILDPDILDLKQKKWNISTAAKEIMRPELKKTVFEVKNGLKDFKVVPIKDQKIMEGCDSRSKSIINGQKWSLSNQPCPIEQKASFSKSLDRAYENHHRYWKENEYNRSHKQPYPITEDRKKFEVIRYFKPYRNPYNYTRDYNNNIKKVKELTTFERKDVEDEVKYLNPGIKNQEKVNAIVHKKMYKIYKDKYNEITGNLDKEVLKKKQEEENKFHWNDNDLINKILAVNHSVTSRRMKNKNNQIRLNLGKLCPSQSQEEMQREILKPLVIKGNEIREEEEKIAEKIDMEYKKQQRLELFQKMKGFNRMKAEKKYESKYPIDPKDYEENSFEVNTMTPLKKNYSMNDVLDIKPHFIEAYQKVIQNELEKSLNRLSKDNDENDVIIEYSHPGVYREFEYDEYIKSFESIEQEGAKIIRKIEKKVEKFEAWSCCLNSDKDAIGCHKHVFKKHFWLNE